MPRTQEQLDAISSTGNVIVSAGAGSGKTSVLTERIVQNIISKENPVHLDEILIVTFTNNAAGEMRTRLKTELGKDERTIHLVPLVDSANICTFDAYFLYLVKKYCARLGISNDITQIPDDIIYVKKNEVLEGFIQKMAENPSEIDKIIFENYCKKNYKPFIKALIEIDKELEGTTDFDALIKDYKENKLSLKGFENFRDNTLFPKILAKFDEAMELYSDVKDDKYIAKMDEYLEPLLANKTFEGFYRFFDNAGTIPSNNKNTESYHKKAKINGILRSISECFKGLNYDNRIDTDLRFNQIVVPYILEIIKNLEIEISKFKREKNAYTFFDISTMAFNLLKDNPDIALSIKNKLKLIMIDEYQDTSKFQEDFINMIANNNVFVVGDVKQSIYGFRGANPQQFIDKYDEYKKGKDGRAIDMNTNFRSREEVTSKINEMFKKVMSIKCGGANYDPDHVIQHGNKDYEDPKMGRTENEHGIFQLNFEVMAKNINDINTTNEIDAIIKDIKVRIANKMIVYDRDLKVRRLARYNDFAILVPASSKFKKVEKRFNQKGVPINAVYDEDIKSDDGVTVLINILRLINCFNGVKTPETKIKHYMLSILRSFLYGYKDQDIYELSLDEKYKECQEYKDIEEFAHKHYYSLIQDTYMDILKDFKYLEKLSSIGNAINKLKYNKIFYERTQIMDNFGYDLNDFIEYLTLLDDLDLKMESRTTSDVKNAVTLTTIHKSKGLQYGVVYMPFAWNKGANDVVDVERFFVNKEYGVFLPSLFHDENKSIHTVFSKFYIESTKASELIRLLYVALTRAQEELCILYGVEPEGEEKVEVEVTKKQKKPKSTENTDEDLLEEFSEREVLDDQLSKVKLIGDIFDVYGMENFDICPWQYIEYKDVKTTTAKLTSESIEISNYEYDFKKLETKIHASKVKSDIANTKALKHGTHLHLLLEGVNFKTKDTSFIKNERERKLIDAVVQNPIFDGLENAKFYKEYEYFDDNKNMIGIIDLLIEKDDELIIIDYKTKNIDDLAYDKQLNIYREYVERAFNKPAKCYLLSIVDNEIREIEKDESN